MVVSGVDDTFTFSTSSGSVRADMYAPESAVDLEERCLNEWWLLETVYGIAEDKLTSLDDGLVYPPEGGTLRHYVFGVGSVHIGDWRPGFCDAAPHLILISAFKVLDAFIEWTIAQNSRVVGYKFSEKIDTLKDASLAFAPFVEGCVWLKLRLVLLYRELEPLRSMIVHGRRFSSNRGTLEVARSADPADKRMVTISPPDLRNLALVAVGLIRYVGGSWSIDPFLERRLRRALDEIQDLHHAPSLSQKPPIQLNARQYQLRSDPIEIDLEQVRVDVETRTPKQDAVFHLRLIVVDRDGTSCEAFLIPFEELGGSKLVRSIAELRERFSVSVPPDTDGPAIAHALVARGQ